MVFPVAKCTNGNFLAAAHWNLDDVEVQTQCSGGGTQVPDCVAAEEVEGRDMANRFRLYSAIQPSESLAGGVDCLTQRDESRVEVRSASLDRSYQGVLSGRYMCKRPDAFAACDDAASIGPSECPLGQCGMMTGFNLAPQSFLDTEVNFGPGGGQGENFDTCCDHEIDIEIPGNCTDNPENCSPLDIQCSSAAVLAVCRPGGAVSCEQTGAVFEPLDRAFWFGPVADIDTGDHPTARPTDVTHPCFQFSFEGTLVQTPPDGDHIRTQPFALGPAIPQPTFDDGCSIDFAQSGTHRDDDFDGVYDECDPVLMNVVPSDGAQELVIRRKIRNVGFSSPFVPSQVAVNFDGTGVPSLAGIIVEGESDGENLTVVVPAFSDLSGREISVFQPNTEFVGLAQQEFVPRWFGYVADGTDDGLLAFDTVTGVTLDGNSSRTNARVNLNCNPADEVQTVATARDLAVRRAAHPENPGVFADREVYSVSDVTLTDLTVESRLFGFRVDDHRLITTTTFPSGVPLPGPAFALDLAEDAGEGMGSWHAYVAWTAQPGFGKITRVDVDDPANEATWGSSVDTNVFVIGEPLGIRAHYFAGGQKVYAYVTSVICNEDSGAQGAMMMPPPTCEEEPCGPGPTEPSRDLYVSVVDVTDPAAASVVAFHKIAHTTPPCSQRPALENFGMEFNEDRSLLFLANPDAERVDVLRTSDHQMDAFVPLPAGSEPVDVDVVRSGPAGEERAYAVGRADQKVYILDVATRTLEAEQILLNPDNDPTFNPIAIAARTDGFRIFVAEGVRRTVGVVDINAASQFLNTRIDQAFTGMEATRLVLLRLP